MLRSRTSATPPRRWPLGTVLLTLLILDVIGLARAELVTDRPFYVQWTDARVYILSVRVPVGRSEAQGRSWRPRTADALGATD